MPGVSAPGMVPGSHFSLCFQPGFPPPQSGNNWHSFPTLTLVGKEASVDVICVVLSSAVGDVKLGPNVPSSTQGIDPVKGRSHYREIHCQVPPPTSSLEQFSALGEFRGLGAEAYS